MRLTINVDCTPEEARAFLGLPDLTPINERMVAEVQKRMEANMEMLDPEALMKNWMNLGGMMTEQFANIMGAASTAAASDEPVKKGPTRK